jgi:hypothetical protein
MQDNRAALAVFVGGALVGLLRARKLIVKSARAA